MTLRRQIATAVAAISVLVAVAVGLLVHQAMVRQHVDQARGSAITALEATLGSYERNEDLTGGGRRHAALDDPELPARLRALAAEGRRGSLLARGPEGESVWAAVPVRGGEVLSVRVGFAQDRQAIADLDRIILLAVVASVFITVLAGVLVADRISRRLRTAATAARAIAAGGTDTRIGELVDGRDEVADLAAAVDLMSRELHRRLEDEQRFTADVAHELRTPLTGLVTAAELLPPGRPTQLVQNRVQALRALVEDLLEVSRLDADVELPDLSAVPLERAVRRTVALTGLEVEVEMAADASVRTDLRRLDRILGNLLLNADRHGGGPIRLHVDAHRLTVRDHGPGFPAELLRDGPQRFRTSVRERGRGHGLGLTIAQGHTRVIGATLTFTNHPTGGAVATLLLPAAPDPAVDEDPSP
ncbi:sensor histidine kinase [Kitasatospora purpeofusca]|uniref:sensor histidine kinase n=1 Tax=Kitasatospora purpeofusca TaxID=67352 RepID=UPI00386A877D